MGIATLFSLLLQATVAQHSECKVDYWEVIPWDTVCDTYLLPDFEFRKVAVPPDAPEYNRFCERFEVINGSNKQEVGYCYTGLGDRLGPSFKVQGKQFMADLGFEGCLRGKPVNGIVFVAGSWSNAPSRIRRLLPVHALPKRVSCAR